VRQLQMFLNEYETVQYDALQYLTGQCNYGGRVTDDHDRRCLMTILKGFYCPTALEENYSYSPSGTYYCPPEGEYEDYLEFVKGFPSIAHPEVFGMHANAEISKDKNETLQILTSLLLTQAQAAGSGSGGPSRDDVVATITAETLERIPKVPFDVELVERKYPITYEESMNTVLKQELIRYNRLIEIMLSTLDSVQKAMRGLIVLSSDLEEMVTQMYNNVQPSLWRAKSYPSLKPLSSYVMDFALRIQFYQDWIDDGQPKVFWISGIFFTHALLTGSLQNFARKHRLPIDVVVYDFEVQDTADYDSIQESPVDGMYVRGLFLEGAIWNYDTSGLDEEKPKALFGVMPVMWFKPVQHKHLKPFKHYECPVYRTGERRGTLATTGHSTNFVMEVRLPSHHPEEYWIKRGTAMVTTLAD